MSLSLSLAKATYELANEIGVDSAISKTKKFMDKNNLSALFPRVQEKLSALVDLEIAKESIYVTSALKLSDDIKDEIRKAHKRDMKTNVQEEIDPTLLAGFISSHKGKQIDTSIKTIISKLNDR